jgi:hypothetical protein
MPEAALQALAMLCSLCGMGWLALAMDVHWAQVNGDVEARGLRPLRLRVQGVAAIVASLGLCLASSHASIAALVWIMSLVVSTLLVAFALATRPRWLVWLARPGKTPGARSDGARS